jgi:hypothetical protein
MVAVSWLLPQAAHATAGRLAFHNGPVTATVTIFPIYYGNWNNTELNDQQAYLENLGRYMSGDFNPAGRVPTTKQYGVHRVLVAKPGPTMTVLDSKTQLTDADVRNIIVQAQNQHLAPRYSSSTLIMLFLPHGFTFAAGICGNAAPGLCGYHNSVNTTSFYSTLPADTGPTLALVTAHEVFEATASPAVAQQPGWDELVDACGTIIHLGFGDIPGPQDNTQNGACDTTGFVFAPPPPTQCGLLTPGQGLLAGSSSDIVTSCDGTHSLALRTDGNLVLSHGIFMTWQSNTRGSASVMAPMQGDGNFLLRRGLDGGADAPFVTNTFGHPGAFLAVQNDGNLVIYDVRGTPIWSTGTVGL